MISTRFQKVFLLLRKCKLNRCCSWTSKLIVLMAKLLHQLQLIVYFAIYSKSSYNTMWWSPDWTAAPYETSVDPSFGYRKRNKRGPELSKKPENEPKFLNIAYDSHNKLIQLLKTFLAKPWALISTILLKGGQKSSRGMWTSSFGAYEWCSWTTPPTSLWEYAKARWRLVIATNYTLED